MRTDDLTPQEAAKEVYRRKRATNSLVEFSQAITIPGAPIAEDADGWLFKPIESAVARHHIFGFVPVGAIFTQSVKLGAKVRNFRPLEA